MTEQQYNGRDLDTHDSRWNFLADIITELYDAFSYLENNDNTLYKLDSAYADKDIEECSDEILIIMDQVTNN